jgi:hypothetical protein
MNVVGGETEPPQEESDIRVPNYTSYSILLHTRSTRTRKILIYSGQRHLTFLQTNIVLIRLHASAAKTPSPPRNAYMQ